MNPIRAIRDRLGVTQAEMARGMACTQSNVSFYEKGQTVPPPAAKALIAFAAERGHVVTLDEIYAEVRTVVDSSPLPLVGEGA